MINFAVEDATLRVDCRNELGEMPLWDDTTGTLYWIDVVAPGRVFYWRLATGVIDFWEFEDLITGLNRTRAGGLLVHRKNDIVSFDPNTRAIGPVFALSPTMHGMRFNDGRCDANGRLWVGTMPNNIGADGAPLAITEYTGQIHVVGVPSTRTFDAGFGCPNGICWSPDGATLYVADSCDGWLYAYRFDGNGASISERRAFCKLNDLGIPDGTAVDRDGFIWNARWGAGAVARISPEGRLDRVVRVPTVQPTACCFGGDDLRTLFVTSARFGLTREQLAEQPVSGGIFSISVDVAGLELAKFEG
jgi:sugar lactone lactonase YvrE